MAGLNDGGFVVTWQSNGQDGALYGVYGQRYDAAGNAQGAEFQVNSYTVSNQSYANVTALADGGFVVTWRSNGQDTSNYGVYGQRYDATGVPQGGEFIVNTYTLDNQQVPSVTALAGGGFVVTWESEGQDGEGYGIYAKRYDVNGLLQGEEFKVNTTSSYHQSNASIAALADGGFVVAWQSQAGFDIFAQRYNAAGVPQGGEFQVNTLDVLYSYEPSITALADGGFVVSWSSFDGNDDEVYAQRYDANGNAVGTKLTGTGNADLINLDSGNAGLIVDGGAGNDTINGAGANDSVLGGEGNDVLNGGAGDDYLNGNFGVDKLNGGAGDDVYVIDTGGGADIITELAGQGIDSVQSIINYTLTTNVENLSLKGSATLGVGNALGNAIEGNAQYNLLDGKAGSDVLDGASGNDTLIGGLGNDLLEGGIGNDVFKFNTALSALNNVDTIVDFSVLDDTIQLSKAIFTTISAGSAAGIALNSTMFNSGAFNVAQDASDRIIYNSSTGDLYYDKDGTGASVAIKFAHLDAGLSLTNADFSVIL
ncbi:MAG: calcium-binding protein [Methylotenera sp.]|nr:calcium-binding protein [Methylotenera sp.]